MITEVTDARTMARASIRFFLFMTACVHLESAAKDAIGRTAVPESFYKLKELGDLTSCSLSCEPCLQRVPTGQIARKFFFLHIPKTGGLSVEMDIRQIVCDGKFLVKNQCFCGRNDSQYLALKDGEFRYKSAPRTSYGWKNFTVFSGHRYWGMLPNFVKESQPVMATILREPIARAVSHWNMVAGRSFGFDNSNNVSFGEAIRYSVRTFGPQLTVGHKNGSAIRNEQVRFLCGVDCSEDTPIDDAVACAKKNLLRTAIVGIHEDMGGFLEQFRAVLPWWPHRSLFSSFSRINSAEDARNVAKRRRHRKSTIADLEAGTLKLLKEFLAPELEVYLFATQLSTAKTTWARSCPDYALSQKCKGFVSDCH